MKKLAILACVMTVSAGMAFAEVVSIPFFSDTNGNSCFVGLQNVSGGTITGSVTYILDNGATIENGGTFSLGNNESFSFRPFVTSGAEVQPATVANASVGFGAISITTSGGPVAGRFVQFGAGGAFGHNVAVN
jgi:hypothetical protein